MICEFRNKLERYSDKMLLGHNDNSAIYSETDLFSVLYWLMLAISLTIVSPIIIPLRLISNKKFVCDKKKIKISE